MARRITVVLSQSARPNPTQRDLEGTLVAELLMVHGLEVTLIPDLTRLKDDDTGLLCLEGITSDMVMLSWLDATQAHQHLAERQILGRPGRTALSEMPAVSVEHPRTIFYIDLSQLKVVADCCEEIKRIREEATVKTYDLGGNGISQAATSLSPDRVKPPTSSPPRDETPQPLPTDRVGSADEDEDDERLERLMEQLDEWDS